MRQFPGTNSEAVSNGRHDLEKCKQATILWLQLICMCSDAQYRHFLNGSVLGGEFVKSHTLKESSSCRPLCPRSLSPVVVER